MTAFADDGVVRLLTEKMQLCKATTTRKTIGERRACSISERKAAAATEEVKIEELLMMPLPSMPKDPHRSSISTVRTSMNETGVGGEGPERSSAKLLEHQKNVHQALPCGCSCGRVAGATRAPQRSSTLRLSRAVLPMFTIDSTEKRAVSEPAEHGRGDCKDADGCARTADCDDGWGEWNKDVGDLGHQKMNEPIRADSSRRGIGRAENVLAGASARANDEEYRHNLGDAPPAPPPGQVCKNGEGDNGLGTCAFDKNSSVVDSPCNKSSTLVKYSCAPSTLNEEASPPAIFPSRGHHRQLASGNDPPATTAVDSTSTTTEVTTAVSMTISDPTIPLPPVGVVKKLSHARGGVFTAATTPASFSSLAGVLGENQSVALEESADFKVAPPVDGPGLPMQSFELRLECRAALDQGYEQASNSLVARKDNSRESGFDGVHDRLEGANADISTTASLSEEKLIGTEGSDFSTDIDGFSMKKELTELETAQTEAIVVGKSGVGGIGAEIDLPESTTSAVVEENGWEREQSNTGPMIEGTSGKPIIAVPTEGAKPYSRSLPAPGEQKSPPNTITTQDEDTEDYEFTFDDEELVAGQKIVRFTDESLWSVHEVRASFEQHELGELFYTTHELDRMLEEAELEEALERSKCSHIQKENMSDDGVKKKGLDVGAVLEGLENASVESLSFDDSDDSDYNF